MGNTATKASTVRKPKIKTSYYAIAKGTKPINRPK